MREQPGGSEAGIPAVEGEDVNEETVRERGITRDQSEKLKDLPRRAINAGH